MERREQRGPVRLDPVAQVPRMGPPVDPNPNPVLPDGEDILTYVWTIYKWLVDQLWVIAIIVIGILVHNYMAKLLKLSPAHL